MILADKIIMLRKKNGWSQEELAEKLGVSRQSISKYEGAQSIPDLDKILKLSEIFGVSTDFLVKDELEMETYVGEDAMEDIPPKKVVTLEKAQEFLRIKKETAKNVIIGTVLCIISPALLIFLAGFSELEDSGISEAVATGIGISVLAVLVIIAVALFIYTGSRTQEFSFLENEEFETSYGVNGVVKELKNKFKSKYTKFNILGCVFCIGSVLPLFVSMIFDPSDFIYICDVVALLILVAIGTACFIYVGIPMSSMNKLLSEEEYCVEKKRTNNRMSSFSSLYWLIATAAYFIYSFASNDWKKSWIIWAVAGILYPAYKILILNIINAKNKND